MRILSTATGAVRHGLGAITEAALVAAIVAVVALALSPLYGPARFVTGTGTAEAGGRTASAVWIDELAGARSAGLAYGSAFTVGYTTSAREPWAQARCFPNDTTIFGQTYADGSIWAENFSVYPGGPMPQGFELIDPIAQNWTGGGADCELQLVKYSSNYSRYSVLATTTFMVVP